MESRKVFTSNELSNNFFNTCRTISEEDNYSLKSIQSGYKFRREIGQDLKNCSCYRLNVLDSKVIGFDQLNKAIQGVAENADILNVLLRRSFGGVEYRDLHNC